MKKLLLVLFVAVFVAGCSKEDKEPLLTVNEKSVSLFYDEEFQIEVKKGSNIISNSSLTFSSSDENVGTVSSSGLFEANRLGKTTVTVSGEGQTMQIEMAIESYGIMFEEPVLEFGSTLASVKGKEKRKLSAETTTGLLYDGENANVEDVFYSFESNRLKSNVVIFAQKSTLVEKLAVFFDERYEYGGAVDDLMIFRDTKKNLLIGFGINSSFGLSALYMESTSKQAMQLKAKAQMGEVQRNKTIQSLMK